MGVKTETSATDPARQLLRHTVATLAYRGGKTLRDAPAGFAEFRLSDRIGAKTRTPGEILAHLGDLLDWALSMARGKEEWHDSPVLSWKQDSERFFKALEAFDACLASDQPLAAPPEKLFQGAIAESLTHVGQIGMLRRLAGAPIRSENYSRAAIAAGRVDLEHAPPGYEFDELPLSTLARGGAGHGHERIPHQSPAPFET